ncbi:hypothetical protein AA0120_g11590 [Alternaria tenuissima]|nr:hypothetical protein AA0120_g11590 [Alternaria tenuissima]RYO52418.1 hypothetical protein AA0116_g11763 [Alternaria tenuissima]
MPGIAVAALYGDERTPDYPLGEIIASSMGDKQSQSARDNPPQYPRVDDKHALCPTELKDAVMFKPGIYAPGMLEQTERLNAICPVPEIAGFVAQ